MIGLRLILQKKARHPTGCLAFDSRLDNLRLNPSTKVYKRIENAIF